MRLRGSVTLFLALILTSCCALICALLESARTAGVRCYAALALDAATDSFITTGAIEVPGASPQPPGP